MENWKEQFTNIVAIIDQKGTTMVKDCMAKIEMCLKSLV